MLKYGVFVYSVLFLVDSIIQGLYENMISSSIVFGLAVIYLFVNLIRDTDDFIVLTPFVTFFSTFLNDSVSAVTVGIVSLVEFIFLWWYHIYRKNNECTESYLNDCRTSVLLSSSLLLISIVKATYSLNQNILISALSLIVCLVLFIYTHFDYIMPMAKRRYGLTKNTEQEELFGINDEMI
jgi:ABC-type xylose transport system permease subunit